jgi:hypothetical protein
MERAEARTVSYTAVEIRPTHVTMIYYLDSPHLRPAPVRETLKRRAAT